MADREKVIKGLEYHLKELSIGKACYECPYLGDNPCEIQLIANALELLKAPEPRLYSFDEVIHLPADTMLWLEEVDEPDGAIIPTAYTGSSFRGDPAEISDSDVIYVCFYGRIMNTCDGYNRYWRCWTAKPTDEQRKAVSWDG